MPINYIQFGFEFTRHHNGIMNRSLCSARVGSAAILQHTFQQLCTFTNPVLQLAITASGSGRWGHGEQKGCLVEVGLGYCSLGSGSDRNMQPKLAVLFLLMCCSSDTDQNAHRVEKFNDIGLCFQIYFGYKCSNFVWEIIQQHCATPCCHGGDPSQRR